MCSREMNLKEYIEQLLPYHAARRQYDELVQKGEALMKVMILHGGWCESVIAAREFAAALAAAGGLLVDGVNMCEEEVRNKALEEAAKVAELRMDVFGGEPTTANERMLVGCIAAAIRELKKVREVLK